MHLPHLRCIYNGYVSISRVQGKQKVQKIHERKKEQLDVHTMQRETRIGVRGTEMRQKWWLLTWGWQLLHAVHAFLAIVLD